MNEQCFLWTIWHISDKQLRDLYNTSDVHYDLTAKKYDSVTGKFQRDLKRNICSAALEFLKIDLDMNFRLCFVLLLELFMFTEQYYAQDAEGKIRHFNTTLNK
jgi:hypothetical protein